MQVASLSPVIGGAPMEPAPKGPAPGDGGSGGQTNGDGHVQRTPEEASVHELDRLADLIESRKTRAR